MLRRPVPPPGASRSTRPLPGASKTRPEGQLRSGAPSGIPIAKLVRGVLSSLGGRSGSKRANRAEPLAGPTPAQMEPAKSRLAVAPGPETVARRVMEPC